MMMVTVPGLMWGVVFEMGGCPVGGGGWAD